MPDKTLLMQLAEPTGLKKYRFIFEDGTGRRYTYENRYL